MGQINIPYIIHEAPMTAAVNISEKNIDGKTKPYAEAILQDLGVQNRNRRIYDAPDLLPQLQCERTIELLRTGNFKGENGHPMSERLERQQTIDPTLVCCKYTKIWNEGNIIKAIVTGTNNDHGKYFDQDLLSGELPSFSLRALGTLQNINGKSYVKNIKLVTWDRVIFPSHKIAYTQRLVNESASISEDNQNQVVVEENWGGRIIPVNNKSIIDYIQKESSSLDIMMDAFGTTSYDNVQWLQESGNVRLFNEDGSTVIMKIDDYIRKEVRDFCSSQM